MQDAVRLDRFLADEGIGSRAEVKKLIRAGRVFVNQNSARQADRKICPGVDEVVVDGHPVTQTVVPTLMLNKPAGTVSATSDAHCKTVIDLIGETWAEKLFPVGRLDKDTEGLLLLTADGAMSHDLLSPRKHISKTYFAVVSGRPDPDLIRLFREGLEIGEKRKTLPAELVFLAEDGSIAEANEMTGSMGPAETDAITGNKDLPEANVKTEDQGRLERDALLESLPSYLKSISQDDLNRCSGEECCVVISITEGKFHQIKRMFGAVGREVHFLKRIAMGCLVLDPSLSPGQYRALTQEELQLLKCR